MYIIANILETGYFNFQYYILFDEYNSYKYNY